VAEKKYEAEE
jgi:hypothetical protein